MPAPEEPRLCARDSTECEPALARVAIRQGPRRRSKIRSLRCQGQNEKAQHLQIRPVFLSIGSEDRKHLMPAGTAIPPGFLSTGWKIRESRPTGEASLDRVFELGHLQAQHLRRGFASLVSRQHSMPLAGVALGTGPSIVDKSSNDIRRTRLVAPSSYGYLLTFRYSENSLQANRQTDRFLRGDPFRQNQRSMETRDSCLPLQVSRAFCTSLSPTAVLRGSAETRSSGRTEALRT